jgi:hypothetical protein
VNANRRDCTLGRPCAPRNRRERLHCLVHHSDLTAHELADRIGCRYDRLIAYAAVNGTDEMPVRHMTALTRETGRVFALAAEAAECGFLLVSEPAPQRVQEVDRELLDVFVSAGHVAERHRAYVLRRAPESLLAVVAAADLAMTELAEFKAAALTDAEPATR